MLEQQIGFWFLVCFGFGNLLSLIYYVYHRSWWALVSIVAICISVIGASTIWLLVGACVFPHPKIIPYEPKMTLCPEQGTTFTIIVPFVPKKRHEI